MKIAFFTEGNFVGKYSRDFTNARVDVSWQIALEATHYPLRDIPKVDVKYDLGIIIIPKVNPVFDFTKVRSICDKIAVMQEGPNWFWQD